MTPEEIMSAAKKLHKSAQTTSSITGARQAAMKAASLVYYLAKNVAAMDAPVKKGMPEDGGAPVEKSYEVKDD